MGAAVQAVTSLVTAPINAITGAIGLGEILPQAKMPTLPTPPATQQAVELPSNVPSADVIKQRQDRIRSAEGLKGGAMGTTANILTGAKGDTSLNSTNKKNLLGA